MSTPPPLPDTSTEALAGSPIVPLSTETRNLPLAEPSTSDPTDLDPATPTLPEPVPPATTKVNKRTPPAPPPPRVRKKKSLKFERSESTSPKPALPTLPSRKANYQPLVSSPLRETGQDGSGDVNADDPPSRPISRAQQRQRSLRIRVVETPQPTIHRRVSTSDTHEKMRRQTADGIHETTIWQPENPFVAARGSDFRSHSPAASLHSVGRAQEFSRYPSRKPSVVDFPGAMIVTGDKVSVTSDIPFASPGSFSSYEGAFAPFGFGVRGDRDGGWLRFPIGASDTSIYPSWNEKEDDDDLHNPAKDGPKFVLRNIKTWNPWICLQFLFLILIVLGVLCAGVLYPILLSIRVLDRERLPERLSEFDFGMLEGIRTSMIDPDTPDYAMTRDSVLGRGKLKLVFSDEFEQDGRTFYPGEDQFWTAPRIHYAATNDLEMYDPDAITTKDGVLEIRFQAYRDYDLDFRSGMLQSWNKLCFKGGVMEVSASLAGPTGVAGLWPGIWSLGNLARPGFRASSDGVWPYSYDQCDVGITPNQSSTDGISFLPGQRLAKCVCKNEDHPSPGTGRGAPEIDALEGTINYDMKIGEVTQSSQIAPFDIWYQTNYDYVAIKNHSVTRMNSWQGGPFQQAVSGVTTLNNDWYDGKEYQKYAFEYIPGKADGAIAWFVGDEETLRMTGNAIGPNGNIGQRDISQEPMSIILNLGMSENWAWIDMERLAPRLAQGTVMRIDYVRIYQEEGKELVTCDPPGYPTTEYVAKHPKAYDNANLTQWDETGYPWPKNMFVDQCH